MSKEEIDTVSRIAARRCTRSALHRFSSSNDTFHRLVHRFCRSEGPLRMRSLHRQSLHRESPARYTYNPSLAERSARKERNCSELQRTLIFVSYAGWRGTTTKPFWKLSILSFHTTKSTKPNKKHKSSVMKTPCFSTFLVQSPTCR